MITIEFTQEEIDLVAKVLDDASADEWGAGLFSLPFIKPAYLKPILEKIAEKKGERE